MNVFASVLGSYTRICLALIKVLLRAALVVDRHERWAVRSAKRLRGSLLKLLSHRGGKQPGRSRGGSRIPWNRTTAETEATVARVHLDHRELGAGRLRALLRRTLGIQLSAQTIRNILARGPRPSAEIRPPTNRIDVTCARQLWGMDLTLVWALGFFPVWLFGVVDYHGSRLITLERLSRPTASEVTRALEIALHRHGRPERVLTDNGAVFKSAAFAELLANHGIAHTRTRPAHPWTNGRIERLFRTFKSTVFAHIWLFASVREIDRYCRDFIQFYNRDRPHSRFGDRTPDEVYFGLPTPSPHVERVTYFDGHLHWYRFG